MMDERGAFLAAARSYIGTPWRHMGRDRNGIDCVGLVVAAARDIGAPLACPEAYARHPVGDELLRAVQAAAPRASGDPRPGEVWVFRSGVLACHVGILSLHPQHRVPALIHAYAARRRVVEEVITGDMDLMLVSRHVLPGIG